MGARRKRNLRSRSLLIPGSGHPGAGGGGGGARLPPEDGLRVEDFEASSSEEGGEEEEGEESGGGGGRGAGGASTSGEGEGSSVARLARIGSAANQQVQNTLLMRRVLARALNANLSKFFNTWLANVEELQEQRAMRTRGVDFFTVQAFRKMFFAWQGAARESRRRKLWRQRYIFSPIHKVLSLPSHVPFLMACSSGNSEAVRNMLRMSGAALAANNRWGSPLHRAARAKSEAVVKMLLEAGASPYERAGGVTALDLAEADPELRAVLELMLCHRSVLAHFDGLGAQVASKTLRSAPVT